MKNFLRYGLTAAALTLMLGAFGATQTNAQINEILKRMDTHYQALKSLQANVAREVYNAQLDETDKMAGNISLRPGKGRNFALRLDWTQPKAEIMTVVNGQYMAYIPGIKRAYTGNSESKTAQEKGGSALRIMSMSREEIKANYDVEYLGQETVAGGIPTWHLKLTPKAKSNYKFANIWVDGNGMPLMGKITQLNNDTDSILLSNLRKNVSIPGSVFSYKIPSGTEIVKS